MSIFFSVTWLLCLPFVEECQQKCGHQSLFPCSLHVTLFNSSVHRQVRNGWTRPVGKREAGGSISPLCIITKKFKVYYNNLIYLLQLLWSECTLSQIYSKYSLYLLAIFQLLTIIRFSMFPSNPCLVYYSC